MARRKPKARGKSISLFKGLRRSIANMKRKRNFRSEQEKQQYMTNLAEVRKEFLQKQRRAKRLPVKKKAA